MPLEGAAVVFKRNELAVDSRVIWVLGDQAGVAFDDPIAWEDVLRNIPSPRHRAPVKFGRPGFSYRELTVEERRLAQSWAWSPTCSSPGK